MKWSKMKIKPTKSRSLFMERGRVTDDQPFQVDDQVTPGVHTKTVKFLGRVIDQRLDDKLVYENLEWIDVYAESCRQMSENWFDEMLDLSTPHCSQNSMETYDVPISQVERMVKCVAVNLWRWLGVSRVLTDIALYCHQAKLRLPVEGLVSSMKKTKVNAALQLQQSKDEAVTRIQPKTRCGRKWNPEQAIDRA